MSNTGANPSVNKLSLAWEAATTTFIRAPLWALYALPSINRPRSAWSLERTLRIRLLQYKPYIVAKTGMWWRDPDYLAIEQGPKVKGFWISPAPDLIVGDVKQWAVNADLESIRIPGYWLEKEGLDLPVNSPPRPGEKVIYAIHGGGFARQSASPNDSTSNIPRGILKHTSTDVIRALTVEYRLTKHQSMKPYNPFPAGLIDVIAGYNHLVNVVGFAPEDIIVEGDSAGGNLALALVRHLIDNQGHAGAQIPRPPGALILCSPWVDLAPATRNIEAAVQYNIPSDFVSVANRGTNSLIATYCGSLGPSAAATNPYLSPATFSSRTNVSFKGYPRTFILAGGAEVLLDSIRLLRQGMTRDIGADQVTYVEKPLAVHDFLTLMWHESERTECLKLIAQWIEPGAKAIEATQSGSGSQTKSLKLKSKL